ncbi:MAG: asparagine synthase (glutamine-hydrolyzing) [Paludibacteraceae bacterium]|nr:asparagine synthase (glutamine-hydrolyzing) [Paludibacteraceae bacterium]
MCGISAIYRYTAISDSDKDKLMAMNEAMHYRGPDDHGIWNDNKCGMAQVRLSIIGLEKGKQPLFNEDQSLVLICNGEIYNYIEIKEELQKKGHVFNSDSDSETILHLYEEYGVKCLEYLRGMFAFCLWDANKKELFAARDRIGEKTLYYSQLQTGVVFSTELKTILKYYIDKPQISIEQLAEPIRYTSPINSKDTYIEQIKRIEPGQYILVEESGLRKYFYWKRDLSDKFFGTIESAKSETLRLMRESVDLCLRSDVPIAVMLSGGIDSSAIAALAKETGREVHTITAGYRGQHDCDEREVAKRFAKEKNIIYHEVELDKNDFKNCFEEYTQYLDEPITDTAAFAQWALYKKVKDMGFKVLLGGNGGDELFYGYPYWNNVSESLTIFRQHQDFFPWKGFEKKKKFLQFFLKNWQPILYAGYPYKIKDEAVGLWYYKDYLKFAENSSFVYDNQEFRFKNLNFDFSFENNTNLSQLDYIYEFLFSKIMTMAYLYLSDRLGMGNSIEIRSPFLDYKLVEYVSSLPQSIKYKRGESKSFLKDVLKGIVPNYILYAQKRGFTPPPSFIEDVISKYQNKIIKSDYNFYNSALADRLLSLHLMNKDVL